MKSGFRPVIPIKHVTVTIVVITGNGFPGLGINISITESAVRILCIEMTFPIASSPTNDPPFLRTHDFALNVIIEVKSTFVR